MSLIKNAAALLLSSAVTLPIAFVTNVVITRSLSVDDRGIYSLATTTIALTAVFAQLGLPATLIMRMRNARTPPSEVAGIGLLAVLAATGVIAIAGLGFETDLRSTLLADAPREIVYLIVLAVPIHLVGNIWAAMARGLDRFVDVSAYLALVSILGLALVSATVWLGYASSVAVILATLAARVAVTLWLTIAVLRLSGITLRLRASEIRTTLRIGIQNYAAILGGQLHERVDVLMIAYFLKDPSEVALYAVAAGIIAPMGALAGMVGQAAFPQLAGLERSEAGTFLCLVVRHATFWIVLLGAVLAAAAPFLIPAIFGAAYAASVPAFLLLVPGVVMLTIYGLVGRYFFVIDRIPTALATQIGAVVFNMAINMVLIPRYGILGAASASLLSYSFACVWLLVLFFRAAEKGPMDLLVFRRDDVEVYRRVLRALRLRLRFPSEG